MINGIVEAKRTTELVATMSVSIALPNDEDCSESKLYPDHKGIAIANKVAQASDSLNPIFNCIGK